MRALSVGVRDSEAMESNTHDAWAEKKLQALVRKLRVLIDIGVLL